MSGAGVGAGRHASDWICSAAAQINGRLIDATDLNDVVATFGVQGCKLKGANEKGRIVRVASEDIRGIGCRAGDGLQLGAVETKGLPQLRAAGNVGVEFRCLGFAADEVIIRLPVNGAAFLLAIENEIKQNVAKANALEA